MSLFRYISRLVDDKPSVAHLYITDRCNLECHYCNEFDNSASHPSREDLEMWLHKIHELGVMRISFQGGEPLLHPDVVHLVRYAKSIGFFWVGMTTNGLLLTEKLVSEFEAAGLDSLQISVDRMTPTETTKKSLKSVARKLDWFNDSPIRFSVAGVLFEDTLSEIYQVIQHCLDRNIPVCARVVHDDAVNERSLLKRENADALLGALDHQVALKASGARISTSWNILDYQKALVQGQPVDWTCLAGYKFFFVSATGKFWLCSQTRTDRNIMDMTPEDLRSYYRPKTCQPGCGVYCTVDTSLGLNHPIRYAAREARGTAHAKLSELLGADLVAGARRLLPFR